MTGVASPCADIRSHLSLICVPPPTAAKSRVAGFEKLDCLWIIYAVPLSLSFSSFPLIRVISVTKSEVGVPEMALTTNN